MLVSGGVQGLASGPNGFPDTHYGLPNGWWTSTQNNDLTGSSRSMIPRSGTVRNFFVALSADPGNTNTRAFTITKNGTATTVTCTITGNAGGTSLTANDQTHSFTVSAGDELSIKIVTTKNGGNVAAGNADWGFEIDTP